MIIKGRVKSKETVDIGDLFGGATFQFPDTSLGDYIIVGHNHLNEDRIWCIELGTGELGGWKPDSQVIPTQITSEVQEMSKYKCVEQIHIGDLINVIYKPGEGTSSILVRVMRVGVKEYVVIRDDDKSRSWNWFVTLPDNHSDGEPFTEKELNILFNPKETKKIELVEKYQ